MKRRKNTPPSELPTMPAPCKTCPFGPNGDKELANKVIDRTLLQASQICHGSEGPNREHRFLWDLYT